MRGSVRKRWASYVAAVLLLAAFGSTATVIYRSWYAFSRLALLERCLFCGTEQRTREIWAMDVRLLRSRTEYPTEVSAALKAVDCGHAFYFAREDHFVFSFKSDPFVNRKTRKSDEGLDVFEHPTFLATLAEVARENPRRAQAIWSRTLRFSFHEDKDALRAIRVALGAESPETFAEFLKSNPYYRPARRNVAQVFESMR